MPRAVGLSRREFLRGAAAAFAAPYVITSSALGAGDRPSPSNRITLGFIGTGGQGIGRNLRGFLGQTDSETLAVCDVDAGHRREAQRIVVEDAARRGSATSCREYTDFREVLVRPDIDAICISTPDHWHVPMSLAAVRAGKDVICEKPTLTVAEGRLLADTVRRYGAVFQTATEDRSIAVYHRLAELVRNGRIGRLQRIRVTLPAGPDGPGDPTPQPVPDGFDYDLWLGPAPWVPYCRGRIHWNFRWIVDYSGGQLTDWGAHLLDTAQWANDTERTGPVEVEGAGKRHTSGLYDTFHEYHIRYRYASGVELFIDSGGTGIRFEGTDGWVASASWSAPIESSSPEILRSVIGPEELHLFTCPAGEHRNFLDCVKSRQDPYFPAEIGHRCSTVAHLGNIAMWTGRKLRWAPEAERFVADPDADRYLARACRAPWSL